MLSLGAMSASRTEAGSPGEQIRVTFTGADRPGLTAELSRVLADEQAELIDVEQVVSQCRFNLNFLIALPSDKAERARFQLAVLRKAEALGLHVDIADAPGLQAAHPTPLWALTVLKNPIDVRLMADLARTAYESGFNIERIQRLSQRALSSVELLLSSRDESEERTLQKGLLALKARHACDLALQRESLTRRNKRLIVMDMDSTLIQQEVIDEIADVLNVKDKVSAITERAMNGELDFDQSLRERVRLLKGTPEAALAGVLSRIKLTEGAEDLVRVLKRLGYRTAVISGGFMEIVEPIQKRLGLDYAFANQLEVKEGLLTGEVLGTIVNRKRKAELLTQIAEKEHIELDQVIAVGDGANDLDMLHRAGLGIAFNAKRTVQEQAKTSLNQPSLTAILYLLGLRDVDTLAAEGG